MKKIYPHLLFFLLLFSTSNAFAFQVSNDTSIVNFVTEDGRSIYLDGNIELTDPGCSFFSVDPTNQEYLLVAPGPMNFCESFEPFSSLDPANGVTVYDMLLISAHILEVKSFDTPYKMIAADINMDGKITAFDIVKARNLILGIDDEFDHGVSWRFFDERYEFCDRSNPFATIFDSCGGIPSGQLPVIEKEIGTDFPDFVGVKLGDVNSTASVRLGASTPAEDRNLPAIYLTTDDIRLQAGQTYTFNFALPSEINRIDALQFEIETHPDITIDQIAFPELIKEEKLPGFSNQLAPNQYNIGWFNSLPNYEGEITEAEFFQITLTAETSGWLSEHIWINTSRMPSQLFGTESYGTITYSYEPRLQFNYPEDRMTELYQNQPNPFTGSTEIRFFMVDTDDIQLNIYDATGSLIFTRQQIFTKGLQSINFENTEGAKGILTIELITSEERLVKKMLAL